MDMTITAATRVLPASSAPSNGAPPMPPVGLPPAGLPPAPGSGNESPRERIAHWMERTFGRAYLPIAMLGGGAIGATIGMLTLGPLGALAGGAGGALLGGALVFAD